MKKLTIIVCILAFVIAIALLKITRAEDSLDMSVSIFDVTQSSVRDSPIYVVASVTSTYELSSVKATVTGTETETKTVELNYNYPEGASKTNWSSYIDLPSWSKGTKTITVTATNIFKSTATSKTVSFDYNEGPDVTTNLPANNTVLQGDFALSAACAECVELTVYVDPGQKMRFPVFTAVGETQLDVVLPLADLSGYLLYVSVVGRNADDKYTITGTRYFIDTSLLLLPYTGTVPTPTDCKGWFARAMEDTETHTYNIYIKPPDTETTRVTFFSTSAYITDQEQALGKDGYTHNPQDHPIPPNGECMFVHENKRYLVSQTTEPKEINSSLGAAFFADKWYILIGETLFYVNIDYPPEPPDPPDPESSSGGGGGCFISALGFRR